MVKIHIPKNGTLKFYLTNNYLSMQEIRQDWTSISPWILQTVRRQEWFRHWQWHTPVSDHRNYPLACSRWRGQHPFLQAPCRTRRVSRQAKMRRQSLWKIENRLCRHLTNTTSGWRPVSQRWAQRSQQKPTINCPVSPRRLCCRQRTQL